MNDELLGTVRELVADPTKAPALHALLKAETTRVIEAMRDESFGAHTADSDEELARRVAAYEALTEDLGRAAAMVAYWSKTTDDRLVPGVVSRLVTGLDRDNGVSVWLDLYLYPAVLVLYGAGLGGVVGQREEQLAGLLGTTVRDRREWKPVATVLSGTAAIDHRPGLRLPGMERRKTPVSDRLCEIVRPWVDDLELDQDSYERAFDRWEYLLGLAMFDLTRAAGRGYAPVGRLSWRGDYGGGIEIALGVEIEAAGSDWPLLRGGLFSRDPARLAESVQGWNEHIGRVRGTRF